MRILRTLILGLAALGASAAPTLARDLTIARATEPSAIDPHFSRTGNNQMTAQHMFERLIDTDANLQIHPGLAVSWTSVDPLTWEIKLRSGVTFHDGSPFTAEDVAFSLERVKTIPNSPAPFSGTVGAIDKVEVVGPLTLRIRTKTPTPQLMEQVGLVYIVSAKAAAGKALEDFNSGAAAIGTGPYKFKEWVPGDRLVLTRNDFWWGEKPDFETVTTRFIANAAARVAALRSGAVDLIDGVPPADVPGLEKAGGINVFSIGSARIIYLALDADRDESPFVTDSDGKPIKPNPLKDARARRAISMMINRKLIIDRMLEGAGEPAAQMVPEGIGGYAEDLQPEAVDLKAAKALLKEAGQEGMGITIHSSNDRFAGDSALAQAIGQMLARGGIKVNGVSTLPYAVYSAAATRREYSAFVFSFGNSTPNAAGALNNVLATFDKDAGTGAFNRTRYSNPAFDDMLKKALSTFDETERRNLLAEATRLAMKDTAIVPLYWPKIYWASRGDITYIPNRNEETSAVLAGVKK